MARQQITFYRSFWDAIRRLKKKDDRLSILEAIVAYGLDEEIRPMTDAAESIFVLVKPTLDAANKKSRGRTGQDRSSGEDKSNEGNSARPEQDIGKIPARHEQDTCKEKEVEVEGEVEVEVEGEKEKESYIPHIYTPPHAPPKKFIPPTVQEVEAYCRERGNAVDAQRFVDHYASVGWKVGKNPMKDWRAAVRTWERNDEGRNNRGSAGYAAAERERPARDYVIVSAKLD